MLGWNVGTIVEVPKVLVTGVGEMESAAGKDFTTLGMDAMGLLGGLTFMRALQIQVSKHTII